MWLEIGIVFCLVFLVINLLLSLANLNQSVELRNALIEIMQKSNPAGIVSGLNSRINEIHEFLAELLKVMGNPFQMLAATHGARILDRIFPMKQKMQDLSKNKISDNSLLGESPSEDAWPEENQSQNEEQEEAERSR